MTELTTYEALAYHFRDSILPVVIDQYGPDDTPAIREAWSNYVDMEAKDGQLTGLEVHYCPAYEDIDLSCDDDEAMAEYLLDQLDVTASIHRIDSRPDGIMADSPRHFKFTITRNDQILTGYFSQGSAWTRPPTREEVLQSLFQEAETADPDFGDFCGEFGFDTDSREAKRVHETCLKYAERLQEMFPGDYGDLAERLQEL